MILGKSSVLFTRKLCFVMGMVIVKVLASWNAFVPITEVGTCPVNATTGEESMFAFASPVTRFVAPGPEVAIQTPALPDTRA